LNKFLPYILGLILLVAVAILFVTGSNSKKKKLDERITLRRQDKIPYGTYVAYTNLKHIFPGASIYTNKYEPGYWDSLSNFDSHQVLIVVCHMFSADEEEMNILTSFAENGNDVFVSAYNISYAAMNMITESETKMNITQYFGNSDKVNSSDSLNLSLLDPPFRDGYTEYEYPGKRYCSYFSQVDNTTTDIIGSNENGAPYFIHLRAGKGNFYVHLAPLAFSNYFILHKNNIEYYEKALSVIKPGVKKVVWDEYYLYKRSSEERPEKKKGWFGVLMNIKNSNDKKPFQAAFWLLILLMLFYVLLEMRRKQRFIPVLTKPRNDSLDFVKTIGRLYYDKGDHKNLCRKMAAYFLEHVRNKYKLPTSQLDDEFVKNLKYKSGIDEPEIRGIVSFIKYLDETVVINNNQLTDFHKQLESFYSKA
jgi:hypothetical protein